MNKISGEFSSFSWGGGGCVIIVWLLMKTHFYLTTVTRKKYTRKRMSTWGLVVLESPVTFLFLSLSFFFFAFLCTLWNNLKMVSLGIFFFFFPLGSVAQRCGRKFSLHLSNTQLPAALPFIPTLLWKAVGWILVACKYPSFWMFKLISYQSLLLSLQGNSLWNIGVVLWV